MAVVGIERLVYAVMDLEKSRRFFCDFGLIESAGENTTFILPEGSRVVLRPIGDPLLPKASRISGPGVHEVIWGVDTAEALKRLVDSLRSEVDVREGEDGAFRFVTSFGVPMGLKVFNKKQVVCAPDPINAPGHVRRLNQHRRWRRRARPKTISHVVFAVPDFDQDYRFMVDKLNFRLSDVQRGFGMYLRADGTYNHHTLLLLNAKAPLPELDGTLKFHHANFGVEDIDELMTGANHMVRCGWESSHLGLGRHRIDSALFYYLPCPAGGDAEYGADGDCLDDSWVPREFDEPLFGYSHYVHNLPPFLLKEPAWSFHYLTDEGDSRS